MRLLASALRRGGLGVVYLPNQTYGSLVFAAEHASLEHVRFALRHGSGILIVSVGPERLRQLDLPLILSHHSRSPAFTASVDAASGTATGISASDRLATIRALADPASTRDDLTRPGHVFPIRYRAQWDSHAADTASYLSSKSGRHATGVSTAILDDAGDVLDLEGTVLFSRRYELPFWASPDFSVAAAAETKDPWLAFFDLADAVGDRRDPAG